MASNKPATIGMSMFTVRILSWNYDAQWLIQDSSEGGAQAPGAPSLDTPLMRAVISVYRCVSITLYAQPSLVSVLTIPTIVTNPIITALPS